MMTVGIEAMRVKTSQIMVRLLRWGLEIGNVGISN